MLSSIARTRCGFFVDVVIPTIVPLAVGSGVGFRISILAGTECGDLHTHVRGRQARKGRNKINRAGVLDGGSEGLCLLGMLVPTHFLQTKNKG